MIKSQRGLTVVELMIVIITMSLLMVTIIAFLMNFWRFSIYQQADLDSLVQRLNTSDYLRESLGTSSGLVTQNSIPDTYPGLVDPADVTGTYWAPVHAVPGTVSTGQLGVATPLMYYTRFSSNQSGDFIYNGTQPHEDEYILYLDEASKSLRVRIIIDPATSATNRLSTTCPPANVTSTCKADVLLISDVDSVDKRFFSRSGNAIDWTSIYDSDLGTYIGPDNSVVEVVELKINVNKRAVFQTVNNTLNTTIIRVALRNT